MSVGIATCPLGGHVPRDAEPLRSSGEMRALQNRLLVQAPGQGTESGLCVDLQTVSGKLDLSGPVGQRAETKPQRRGWNDQ